jgi:hypothetical protein
MSATFSAAKTMVKMVSLSSSPQMATNGIISTEGNGGNETYQWPFSKTQSFRFGGCPRSASCPWRNASACQTKCGASDWCENIPQLDRE